MTYFLILVALVYLLYAHLILRELRKANRRARDYTEDHR